MSRKIHIRIGDPKDDNDFVDYVALVDRHNVFLVVDNIATMLKTMGVYDSGAPLTFKGLEEDLDSDEDFDLD